MYPLTLAVSQFACGSGLMTVHVAGIGFDTGPPARSISGDAAMIGTRPAAARRIDFMTVTCKVFVGWCPVFEEM